MTRQELLDWLQVDGEQLDRLLERGLPTQPGGQYSPVDVASWLEQHGLTEAKPEASTLPAGVVRTKREAAKALGRTRPTLDDWLAAGCPGQEGYYDVEAIRRWRDQRDRELKRPVTYGSPKALPAGDVDELRGLVREELLDHNGLIIGVLQAAFDAIEAKLPEISKDPKLKSELLKASFEAAMPFMVGKDEIEPAVEARVESVLKLVS